MPNKCPNCHFQVNDRTTDTGRTQKKAPDPIAPKTPTPGTNVRLNEVLFDARTGRFIVAKTEEPDPGFLELRDQRKEFFPHKKDLPRTTENLPGKEFKQLVDPNAANSFERRKKVDEVTKSCTDLCIDG